MGGGVCALAHFLPLQTAPVGFPRATKLIWSSGTQTELAERRVILVVPGSSLGSPCSTEHALSCPRSVLLGIPPCGQVWSPFHVPLAPTDRTQEVEANIGVCPSPACPAHFSGFLSRVMLCWLVLF